MVFGIKEALGVGLSLVKASLNKKNQTREDTQMRIIQAEKTGRIPTSDPQYSTVRDVSANMDTAARIVRRAEATMKPVSISKGIGEGTSGKLRDVG